MAQLNDLLVKGNVQLINPLPVSSGGTGLSTITTDGVLFGNGTGSLTVKAAGDALNFLIDKLTDGTNPPKADDNIISQYVGGGTTTKTYHRRPWKTFIQTVHNRFYATCSTAGDTVAKVASTGLADGYKFVLNKGAVIAVKFTNAITVANATLNIDSTGAIPIYYRGSALAANKTSANATYWFVYNGSTATNGQYELVNDLDTNTNTTYSAGAGLTLSTTTFKAKLRSETAASVDAAAFGSTANRYYSVGVDKSGYLAVNIPWVADTDIKVKISNKEADADSTWYPTFYTGTTSDATDIFTNNGFVFRVLNGTTSTDGYAFLRLGNTTKTGVAGNKYGKIVMYSNNGGYHTITPVIPGTGSSVTHTLTDTSGWLVGAAIAGVGGVNNPVYINSSGIATATNITASKVIWYGTCSTAASTAAKVVTCPGYALENGNIVIVKFTNSNTKANPTLNVNSTGAKAIKEDGAAVLAANISNVGMLYFRYVVDGDNSWYEYFGGDRKTYLDFYEYNSGTTASEVTAYPVLAISTADSYTVMKTSSGAYGFSFKYGNATIGTEGQDGYVAATSGMARLRLGNTLLGISPSGDLSVAVDGNTTGVVRMYNRLGKYTDLYPNDNTGNIVQYLPIGGGTLVLGSNNGTATGNNMVPVYENTSNKLTACNISLPAWGTCSTAAGTAAKAVTSSNFKLGAGSFIVVQFSAANTATSPTLNVNSTGAKAIWYKGAAIASPNLGLLTGRVAFIYDGTQYHLIQFETVVESDTTSTASPAHSGTFTVVDSVTRDSNGHVTKINTKTVTLPASGDTHWTANLITGASSSAKANAAATNGNVWLNLVENDTVRNAHNLVGSNITITSDANGKITFTGTANDNTLGFNVVGASNAAYANAAATDGNVWLNHIESTSTVKSKHNIVGLANSSTSVVSDANGKITIGGPVIGTCDIAANTAAKTVTLAGYVLRAGAIARIKFTYKNTKGSPTLNINSTGAKAIWIDGAAITAKDFGLLGPDEDYTTFIYDGTQYRIIPNAYVPVVKPFETKDASPVLSATNFYPLSTNAYNGANTGTFANNDYRLQLTTGKAAVGTEGQDGYEPPVEGKAALILGNSTAYPNANNTTGVFCLYSKTGKYQDIFPYDNLSNHGYIMLPNYTVVDPPAELTYIIKDTAVGNNITPVYVANTGKVTECNTSLPAWGTCSTAAGTAAKVVTSSNFKLGAGSLIVVQFSAANTAASPTLNVNSTEAKAIWINGAAITSTDIGLLKGRCLFVYDGTQYHLIKSESHNVNYNQIKPYTTDIGYAYTSGALDAITIPKVGSAVSNKSFNMKAADITIEYSTDAGATWTDYGATDTEKRNLFTETRATNFYLGHATTKENNNVNNQLRVTITPTDRYYKSDSVYVWFSTQGNTCNMSMYVATNESLDTLSAVFENKPISGWSGNNIIYYSPQTIKKSTASGDTTKIGKVVFLFKMSAISTKYASAIVMDIRMFGDTVWTIPNKMVGTNHLYSWDTDLNSTFQAKVFGSNIKDNGVLIGIDGATADIGASNKPVYISYNSGKPKAVAIDYTIPSSIVTSVTGTSPISVSPTTGAVVVSHANSGVTGGVYGDVSTDYTSANVGDTFNIPRITVNPTGHITNISNSTIFNKGYVYPVKGTQTAETNTWTGDINIPHTHVYDGLTIAYYLPWNGTSGATLTLTCSDDITFTGNVYWTAASRATTHYGAGSTILLTYWSAGSISVSGTATTDNRWLRADYNSDTNTYQRIYNVSNVALANATNERNITFDYTASTTTAPAVSGNNSRYGYEDPNSFIYGWTNGTASALGISTLGLGNNIASGTIGNKYGVLRLYASNTYKYEIHPYVGNTTLITANKDLTLPNTTGWIVGSPTGSNNGALGNSKRPIYIKSGGVAEIVGNDIDMVSSFNEQATTTEINRDILFRGDQTSIDPSTLSDPNYAAVDPIGLKYTSKPGTSSVVGYSFISLGNSTASGTAGNKEGYIKLYGTNGKLTGIQPGAPSNNGLWLLPQLYSSGAVLVGSVANAGSSQTYGGSSNFPVYIDEDGIATTTTGSTVCYGTCSTASGTAAKVVVCSNFELENGAIIKIRFSARTSKVATLNINSTGAKPIWTLQGTINASGVMEYAYAVMTAGDYGKIGPATPYVTFRYDSSLGSSGVYCLIDSSGVPPIYQPQDTSRNTNLTTSTNFYLMTTNGLQSTTNTGMFVDNNARLQQKTGHAAIGTEGDDDYVAPVAGTIYFVLGNASNSTTEGNEEGQLAIYSANTKGHYVKGASTTTWYTHTLPNATGYLLTGNTETNPTSSTTYNIPFLNSTSDGVARTNDGIRYITLEGVANTEGYGILLIGNNIAKTSAKNKTARLRMFGDGTTYTEIKGASPSENRTLFMPTLNDHGIMVARTSSPTFAYNAQRAVYPDSSGLLQCVTDTLALNNTTLSKGTNPSGNIYTQFIFYDKDGVANGNVMGGIQHIVNSSGQATLAIMNRKFTASSTDGANISLVVTSAGASYATVPNPAVATAAARNIKAGTSAYTAGTTDLATGSIYLQYEA